MNLAFLSGNLDASLSYRRVGAIDEDTRTVSRPAPYFVAMLPNPASELNRGDNTNRIVVFKKEG